MSSSGPFQVRLATISETTFSRLSPEISGIRGFFSLKFREAFGTIPNQSQVIVFRGFMLILGLGRAGLSRAAGAALLF
jgi:hypothetical protein